MKHIEEAAKRRLASKEVTASNETKFVDALTKVGMKCVPIKPSRDLRYKVTGFTVPSLTKAMKAAKWESQGADLFPDSDGMYYVQNTKGEELAVFERVGADYTLEFSGY